MATPSEPYQTISFNGTTFKGDTLLEGWTSYFEHLSVPIHHSTFNTSFQQDVNEEFLSLLDTSLGEEILFTPGEIEEAIRNLKSQKAPGPDETDPEYIIYPGPLAHHLLTDLFNAIATTGHIPAAFQFRYAALPV